MLNFKKSPLDFIFEDKNIVDYFDFIFWLNISFKTQPFHQTLHKISLFTSTLIDFAKSTHTKKHQHSRCELKKGLVLLLLPSRMSSVIKVLLTLLDVYQKRNSFLFFN